MIKKAFFDHVPKTGGTSLQDFFRFALGDDRVSPFVMFKRLNNCLSQYANFDIIAGHFIVFPGDFPTDRIALTILRNPLDRMLSEYSAILYDEIASAGEALEATRLIKSLSIEEVVNSENSKLKSVFDNRMTRHFAEYNQLTNWNDNLPDLLDSAKRALDAFHLVGILEDIEGFVGMICECFHLKIPDDFPISNQSSRRIQLSDLNLDMQHRLKELNQYDMALYDYAKKRYVHDRKLMMRRLLDNLMNVDVVKSLSDSPRFLDDSFVHGDCISDNNHCIREFGNKQIWITDVQILGEISKSPEILSGETVAFRICFATNVDCANLTVGFGITNVNHELIFGTNSYLLGQCYSVKTGGSYSVYFKARVDIGLGEYYLNASLHSGRDHLEGCYHWVDAIARFAVVGVIGIHFEGSFRLFCSLFSDSFGEHGILVNQVDRPAVYPLCVQSKELSDFSANIQAFVHKVIVVPGEIVAINAQITNLSSETWPCAGTRPVCIAYHVYTFNRGELIDFNGERTRFPHDIVPGETIELPISILAPYEPGEYKVLPALVQEMVGWFENEPVSLLENPALFVHLIVS